MTQLTFGTVAPTSRRAVAYVIDALIAGGLGVVLSIILVIFATVAGVDGMLGVLAIGGPLVWLVMVGWFVVYTLMQSGKGSIGMRAQGLRLAQETTGAPLGFGRTLLRNIIFGLSASIFVGYFTPLFDGSGRFQGWHDKVAKSVMLDARTSPLQTSAPAAHPTQIPPLPQSPLPAAGVQPAPRSPLFPQLVSPNPAAPQPTFPQQPAPPIPGLPSAPAPTSSFAAPQPAEPWGRAQAPTPSAEPSLPPEPAVAPDAQPVARPAFVTDDPLIAFVPGITQDAPPPRNAPAPAAQAPAEAADSAILEETQLRGDVAPAPAPVLQDPSDVEDTRISIPGHRLIFTWDDGTKVTVSQRTIFGRNPAPEQGAVTVSVRDETLSLSKTHFEAAAEASGGWIIDRNSTNGTAVVRDGHRIICTPGESVRIRLGDAIEIGDRIVTVGGYA
ncbi:MAG: RDD family protein [Microbacterium sp.]|uniref:RDD family protein n=1 Tax=Microbacterium sp. TaxID=51671 RepID=UPI003F9895CF